MQNYFRRLFPNESEFKRFVFLGNIAYLLLLSHILVPNSTFKMIIIATSFMMQIVFFSWWIHRAMTSRRKE